jgi:hypothetical protein
MEENHSIHKELPPRISFSSMAKTSSFVDGRGSIISNPTTTLMMNATTARERARRENLTRDTAFAIDPSNTFQEVEIPLKSGSNQAIHEMQKVIAKEFIKVHDWFEELENSFHDFQDERQAAEVRQLKAAQEACSLPDPAAAKPGLTRIKKIRSIDSTEIRGRERTRPTAEAPG